MNTAMYSHKFTAKHLRIVQEELEYTILGPQGAGKLACGDEGELRLQGLSPDHNRS
jgi:phosphopantothenoylcysteine decarboxylase